MHKVRFMQEDITKKISFEGINNRYQIKKLVDKNKVKKIRKNVGVWNFKEEMYKENSQHLLLEDLCKQDFSEECVIVKREIEKKLQGYKQQDVEKKRYLPENFIDFKTVIDELHKSSLKCYYCSQSVFLIYEQVREQSQWTLDRIDNEIGHNRNNVLISCLECNLKRRKTNKDKFLFTKNLKLIKT